MSRQHGDELHIDFLPPKAGAFGTTSTGGSTGGSTVDDDGDGDDGFDPDEPRSKTVTLVAVLAALALVVTGVVAAAPWDSGVKATPPPTSPTTPPTTPPTAPPTAPPPMVGDAQRADVATELPRPIGWVVDPPDLTWAFTGTSLQPGISGLGYLEHLDVWAEPGATRTGGRWLAIRSSPFVSHRLLPDGARIDAGGRAAAVATSDDGVTTLEVRLPDDDGTLELRSHGILLDELVDLASWLVPVAGPSQVLDYGERVLADRRLLGLDRVLTASIPDGDDGLLGAPEVSTWYTSTTTASMQVSQRPLTTATGLTVVDLLLPRVEVRMEVESDSAVDTRLDLLARSGRIVDLRTVPSDPRMIVASWVDGDQLVTLAASDTSLGAVVEAVSTARLADEPTWRTMAAGSGPSVQVAGGAPPSTLTLTGPYPTGDRWQAFLSRTSLQLTSIGLGPTTVDAFAFLDDRAGTSIRRFASADVSVVLAISFAPARARTMRVTVDGVTSEIEMEPLDTGSGIGTGTAAVLPSLRGFPELVELLDENGDVVLSEPG